MKSPGQMGDPPRQRKKESMMEDKEGKPEKLEITTPEEAEEKTRQRRSDFGLGEAKKFKPEETKKLEESIKDLLKSLDNYDFVKFSPKIQEDWYWVELEATAGKDRQLAEVNLKRLLKVLQKEAEKIG